MKEIEKEEIRYEDNSEENISWVISEDVKKSYERFIEIHKESKYSNLIKDYYEILKKNKFRFSKDAEKFLNERGIDLAW